MTRRFLAPIAWRTAFAAYLADLGFAIGGAIALSALGHGVWYVVRCAKRRSAAPPPEFSGHERRVPERLAKELVKCLELGECVERDASALSSSLAAPSAANGKVPRAAQQVRKSAEALARRLRRIVDRTERSGAGQLASSLILPAHDADADLAPDDLEARDYSGLTSLGRKMEKATRWYRDARQFPRTPCDGIAKATIYPAASSSTKEQIQCLVEMRSISCGGISFEHHERLYPQQIVVIEVAGKLLVGEIRWCKKGDDKYIAGCQLVKACG
jgi:hypothetical protein